MATSASSIGTRALREWSARAWLRTRSASARSPVSRSAAPDQEAVARVPPSSCRISAIRGEALDGLRLGSGQEVVGEVGAGVDVGELPEPVLAQSPGLDPAVLGLEQEGPLVDEEGRRPLLVLDERETVWASARRRSGGGSGRASAGLVGEDVEGVQGAVDADVERGEPRSLCRPSRSLDQNACSSCHPTRSMPKW
jgi:hypothetical protein